MITASELISLGFRSPGEAGQWKNQAAFFETVMIGDHVSEPAVPSMHPCVVYRLLPCLPVAAGLFRFWSRRAN